MKRLCLAILITLLTAGSVLPCDAMDQKACQSTQPQQKMPEMQSMPPSPSISAETGMGDSHTCCAGKSHSIEARCCSAQQSPQAITPQTNVSAPMASAHAATFGLLAAHALSAAHVAPAPPLHSAQRPPTLVLRT